MKRRLVAPLVRCTIAVAWLLTGCAIGGVLDDNEENRDELGALELALEIPGDDEVATVDLYLVCENLQQHHTLDVSAGEVVAAFGGLSPGSCQVSGSSTSLQGSTCSGEEQFQITAGQTTEVTLTLFCQGLDETPSGGVRIDVDFDFFDCSTERIANIEVDPGYMLLGESATVSIDIYSGTVVGLPSLSFAVRNDLEHRGQATLSSSTNCTSFDCVEVTCTGVGENPTVDAVHGLPSGKAIIAATIEDDECFHTEAVQITCLAESACGDLLVSGDEECDDGNVSSGDGCDSQCGHEYCDGGICVGDGGVTDSGDR